ncbi:MAG: aromatic ring-hydroxylating dioxygenase subunit alpha [Proteobacteria bacterium]|nr:aromatic ring-hydroxylating dioxygenase subunit alpha [Pseudomonadota bacterium]
MTGMPTYNRQPYGGYHATAVAQEDAELTHVGPGTPCGEYLRRFWHPVALSSQLKDLPLPVRALGEDLVLFRDLGGRVGLLHRHCSHRGTSLEFGIVSARGIRCCYHGWLFDVDGTVLETPGEPPGSRLKDNVCHGAYPAFEYKGIVFAYLGPPAEKPEFPIYDSFALPGDELVPYLLSFPCNWLQANENGMDPIHSTFLHTRVTTVQFEVAWGELPVIDWNELQAGFFTTNARRWGDNIWVRLHDQFSPNMGQTGALWETAETEKFFTRVSLTRWCLPVDDHNCQYIAWRHFNQSVDPQRKGDRTKCGVNRIDFPGQTPAASYEAAQRVPGDYEAWIGQRRIAVHKQEHLGTTDKGVAMARQRLRRQIQALRDGGAVVRPQAKAGGIVPTHSGDVVLRVPKSTNDDRALILDVSRRVRDVILAADDDPEPQRQQRIERDLRALSRA